MPDTKGREAASTTREGSECTYKGQVYAWLIFCDAGKKDYVQTAEDRISGCLVSCDERGRRGDNLGEIGREFNITRFSSVSNNSSLTGRSHAYV